MTEEINEKDAISNTEKQELGPEALKEIEIAEETLLKLEKINPEDLYAFQMDQLEECNDTISKLMMQKKGGYSSERLRLIAEQVIAKKLEIHSRVFNYMRSEAEYGETSERSGEKVKRKFFSPYLVSAPRKNNELHYSEPQKRTFALENKAFDLIEIKKSITVDKELTEEDRQIAIAEIDAAKNKFREQKKNLSEEESRRKEEENRRKTDAKLKAIRETIEGL